MMIMQFTSISILPLFISCVACQAYTSFFQQDGTTKLLGSSFGLLGKNATYDYVVGNYLISFYYFLTLTLKRQIVGGGTSGLTVAKRLAEDPKVSVAVIEAGGFYELDNSNISQIPAYYTFNVNSAPDPASIQPLIDWGIITAAQKV